MTPNSCSLDKWLQDKQISDPRLDKLRGEVEHLFNSPITVKTANDLPPNMFAAAVVEDNGTPTIDVLPNDQRRPEDIGSTIVHELLHLKRRATGYPLCYLVRSKPDVLPEFNNDKLLHDFGLEITNLIEHSAIFEEMRGLSLNPDSESKKVLEKQLNDKARPTSTPFPCEMRAALNYLQTSIELSGTEYPARQEERLTAQGFADSVARAKQAYARLETTKPSNPVNQGILNSQIVESILNVDVTSRDETQQRSATLAYKITVVNATGHRK